MPWLSSSCIDKSIQLKEAVANSTSMRPPWDTSKYNSHGKVMLAPLHTQNFRTHFDGFIIVITPWSQPWRDAASRNTVAMLHPLHLGYCCWAEGHEHNSLFVLDQSHRLRRTPNWRIIVGLETHIVTASILRCSKQNAYSTCCTVAA